MKKPTNYNLSDYDLVPLPSDAKLEKMILGLFIDLPHLVEQMFKYISLKGIFYNNQNNKVWNAIQELISIKMIPNKANVEGFFTRINDNETAVYARTLPFYAGEITMIKQYCLKLFEIAILRNIIRIGYDINQRAYANNDALELLADASNGLGKMYESIAGMNTRTLEDGVQELAEELVEIANSPDGMLGIKGTMPSLNNIFKGYRKGNMIVIAASSGEGKSTFMLQEASFMATLKIPVGIISLEMTQSELLLKICCEKLNMDIASALSGKLTTQQMEQMSLMLGKIKEMPFHITETPALKIGEVKATARMWKNRNKIKCLFIDHLHLINGDIQYINSEQKFSDIANQIKELAKELDIPVVALAQLARKDNLTEKRMHVMTDLKYAGGIEQAADVIFMIYRPEEHGIETTSDGDSTKGKAMIKVDKLRLLKKGTIKCEFDGLRFSESNFNDKWSGYTPDNSLPDPF